MQASNMNVLLITMDDVRADHLSCYGYHLPTTPVLDELAQRGVVFRQAISNGPSTWSSFPSIITSTYPLLHGGYARLEAPRKTIAAALRSYGFVTAAFLCNSYIMATPGYERGFQVFEDVYRGVRPRGYSRKLSLLGRLHKQALRVQTAIVRRVAPRPGHFKTTAEDINRHALGFLRKLRGNGRPFFVWLYYVDVHFPWIPLKEYRDRFLDVGLSLPEVLAFNRHVRKEGATSDEDLTTLRALYDASLNYVDAQIGSLLEGLDMLRLRDSTVIIIVSDHGEKLGERDGGLFHPPQVYEELIRVPLILVGRSIQPAEVTELVSNLDIAPTILDLLALPKNFAFQGRNLLLPRSGPSSEITDGYFVGAAHKKSFVYESAKRIVGYRTERWKYIHDDFTGKRELYDLRVDPRETTNLVGSGLVVQKKLEEIMAQHLADIELGSSYEADFDQDVMDRLRALGYID